MQISPIKTNPVQVNESIITVLDSFCPVLQNNDVLCITSKIISLCEGNAIKTEDKEKKRKYIHQCAEYYIDEKNNQYGVTLTITKGILIASAGIDESNGNGHLVFWPKDPFFSAKTVWSYLRKKFGIKNLGIIITDSHTTPLRWGTSGIGIAWCGFHPLNSYIGKPDIFNRKLTMTKASILDGLAASAVVAMGEGNEQTPLCLIRDIPLITFTKYPPSAREIDNLKITIADDIYAPILSRARWKKGDS